MERILYWFRGRYAQPFDNIVSESADVESPKLPIYSCPDLEEREHPLTKSTVEEMKNYRRIVEGDRLFDKSKGTCNPRPSLCSIYQLW